MKIINADVEILTPINGEEILNHIEKCGRLCYKSEYKITEDSAHKFIANIIKRGHEAVLEHYNISVKFICDRGTSHQIVRHRIASFCQSSTRYCNYSQDKFGNEITVIKPCFWDDDSFNMNTWKSAMKSAERSYLDMINCGATPEEARSVLPNSLMTELIMTANIREWRHFLKLRCAKSAHPQIREIAVLLLNMFRESIPVLFDDIDG